ncbi:biotin/lipoyl-containing protein [Ruegeria atlantica]|uniref:biotin/lipoyl-containing protein n=1 Tax=Ruegeria atlantica TaxID=81569 RepID=UPI0014805D5A|nr:biotin/lipoyl-containing protein [Ruegeria atlantica]
MPLEVIMPALGMAQDSGVLVAWHKSLGDAVDEGDILFEVETDKATMEVEAQGTGFLTKVHVEAGTTVPVGERIATISETLEIHSESVAVLKQDTFPAKAEDQSEPPIGQEIIMPALGMAQDTGLIVSWRKQPGEAVAAEDILFEVETDKSTVEVATGHNGFLAGVLAGVGDNVQVGQVIAVVTADAPDVPYVRSSKVTTKVEKEATSAELLTTEFKTSLPIEPVGNLQREADRILASPKARRLVLEQGLELSQLVNLGYPQPYHAADIDLLKAPLEKPNIANAESTRHLVAEVTLGEFIEFSNWAADMAGISDPKSLLASFAAASLGHPACIEVETFGKVHRYKATSRLGATVNCPSQSDDTPDLRLRDLRNTSVKKVHFGPEEVPVLTMSQNGALLRVTLECTNSQFSARDAATLLAEFAGRLNQPLRHLL